MQPMQVAIHSASFPFKYLHDRTKPEAVYSNPSSPGLKDFTEGIKAVRIHMLVYQKIGDVQSPECQRRLMSKVVDEGAASQDMRGTHIHMEHPLLHMLHVQAELVSRLRCEDLKCTASLCMCVGLRCMMGLASIMLLNVLGHLLV